MLDTYAISQAEMPKEMRFLFDQYPRDNWDAHPGFKEKTKHWLRTHQMCRLVAERVRLDTETQLDRGIELEDCAGSLSHYGGNLVGRDPITGIHVLRILGDKSQSTVTGHR